MDLVTPVLESFSRSFDMTDRNAQSRKTRDGQMETPTDLGPNATKDIAGALNALLADAFALFLKTKNFHWHVSGPHFRDYHLLFEEQATEILAITDEIAERVRKVGGSTLRSIGDIARHQRLQDNDAPYVDSRAMLAELCEDNKRFIASMRQAQDVCNAHKDVASVGLLDNFIDQAEKRAWFLYEASRSGEPTRQ
jgi:starvation-inducible DNA-binding protein